LTYQEWSGNWKEIFRWISMAKGYNYFSRGLNEILEESKKYPDLAIEKHLVLIYDRDFLFYLSRTGKNAGAQYHKIIEAALMKARDSGLVERLVGKYWNNDFTTLGYHNRVKLYLKTPE
jgi:hypothetical protein